MNKQRKWLRVAAWVLAVLAALVAAAIFVGLQLGDSKMQRRVEVSVQPVPPRTDAQALELGPEPSGYTMPFPVPGSVTQMQSNMAATLNMTAIAAASSPSMMTSMSYWPVV